ncbi:hypothetical protein [Streptomyces fuscichromogenes]|uniref:Uncharacterized protein n=1 Tax=Streptomyces fuscichromogenes TaxID=1324013 RepID=A0A918CRV3_9ACTN|nr:hypothetical protein [Streptomyces fuscichromogenes]GGN13252.1 hypothetical protein GCM10011578_040460 [Streptomyces fuscichromogenes]
MSLFVPESDESVILREAEAEAVGGDPVGVRLLADSNATGAAVVTAGRGDLIVITPGERYDNHYLRSEAWDTRR